MSNINITVRTLVGKHIELKRAQVEQEKALQADWDIMSSMGREIEQSKILDTI